MQQDNCDDDHDQDDKPSKGNVMGKMKKLMHHHYKRFKAMGHSDAEAIEKAKMAVKSAVQ